MSAPAPFVPSGIQTPYTDAELLAWLGQPYADLQDYSAEFDAKQIDTYWTRMPFQKALLALKRLAVPFPVINKTGGTLDAGPVYVSGMDAATGYLEITAADAAAIGTAADGIIEAALAADGVGILKRRGLFISTFTSTVGTELFLADGGGISDTPGTTEQSIGYAYESGANVPVVANVRAPKAVVTAADMPAGTTIQVVQAHAPYDYSDIGTNSNGTYVTTGLSASITPRSVSNKVRIKLAGGSAQPGANGMWVTIKRAGTDLAAAIGGATPPYGFEYFRPQGTDQTTVHSVDYIDLPATTGATTYEVFFYSDGGGTVYFHRGGFGGAILTLTLEEIVG